MQLLISWTLLLRCPKSLFSTRQIQWSIATIDASQRQPGGLVAFGAGVYVTRTNCEYKFPAINMTVLRTAPVDSESAAII